jgi:hypothetical protein
MGYKQGMFRWFSALKMASATLAAAMLLQAIPQVAYADGGASTRNIILGGAAAAGTLLIINHNKKVHERYAEDAQRQAATASERNQAQAAYAAERSAYDHQLAINGELQKETALQHRMIVQLQRDVAQWKKRVAAQKTARKNPPLISYGWGRL